MWDIRKGDRDWGYPNTVDMTLYRKKDMELDLKNLVFSGPNELEGRWSWNGKNSTALCFDVSKIVNIPLNRVQSVSMNPHMNYMNTQQLLDVFEKGKKIDITTLFKMKNPGSHMDYVPHFINRN